MDDKFIELLSTQINECQLFLSYYEDGSAIDLSNKSAQWGTETENYLRYAIENQNYLKEFRDCNCYYDNGNSNDVGTLYKKLGYLNSFVKLLQQNYISTKTSVLKNNTGSSDVFVAMWFDEQMNDFYNLGVKKVVESLGYKPVRVDEHQHNNKIDIEIISLIEKSAYLIADLTGDRSGVYYEAGYAKGLGIQVIYSVKREGFDLVHFDVEHENLIIWNDVSEYSRKLEERIRGTFGTFREIKEKVKIDWEE